MTDVQSMFSVASSLILRRKAVIQETDGADMLYAYCIIPSGKSDEFALIDANLIERNIKAKYFTTSAGGRVYRIPSADIEFLHVEAGVPHLGYKSAGGPLRLFRIISDRRQRIREDLHSDAWNELSRAMA